LRPRPALATAAEAASGDWRQSRGDARNSAVARLQAPASDPVRSWTFEASGRVFGFAPNMTVWSSPALGVIEGRAVIAIGSYDKNVYLLDAASGSLRWKFTTGDGVFAAPAIYRDGSRSMLFVASSDRLLYALDGATGQRLWIHSVQEHTSTLGGARLAAPCVIDVAGQPTVFVAHWVWDRSLARNQQEAGVSALVASDGRPLWRTPLGDNELTAPLCALVAGQPRLFVGSQNGNLYALDAASGQRLWQHTELDAIRSPPALELVDGRPHLVVASKYGLVRALDAASGTEIWRFKTGERITGSPAIAHVGDRDLVVVGAFDRTLYALDLRSGQPVWRYWARGGIYASPALLVDGETGSAIAASWDHHLHGVSIVDGQPQWLAYTGQPLWESLAYGESNWSSPAAAQINGSWMVYAGSYSGTLYGLPLDQIAGKQVFGPRANVGFWISLPLSLLAVVGLALLLTRTARRRQRARLNAA